MKKLNRQLLNRYFSHIYIENDAFDCDITKDILKKLDNSKIIKIQHYKDVFSRGNQNFLIQKQTPKLILAKKRDNLIYKGADVCEDFGNENFYYTSIIMNCIYDCEYCYLQGIYTSANIVVFVNIEDYFKEVEEILKTQSVYLCVSYDTDMLAFENFLGYTRRWIEFAKKHDNLKIEIRTKSCNFKSIQDIKPKDNIILAWTLSPNKVIDMYENKTPSLKDRIDNIKFAICSGWNVRLCFDPILYVDNWMDEYKSLIEYVFDNIDGSKIYDVSIGVFRVSKDYLKKMRRQRKQSIILNYPFEIQGGVASYGKSLGNQMVSYVYELLKMYVSEDKIYV